MSCTVQHDWFTIYYDLGWLYWDGDLTDEEISNWAHMMVGVREDDAVRTNFNRGLKRVDKK